MAHSKFIIPIVLILFYSCNNERKVKSNSKINSVIDSSSVKSEDSVLFFEYKLDAKHQNILNTSDKQIDILFNGIEDFLGNYEKSNLKFSLEFCMTCASVQKYKNGILFAKRLLITPEKINYYKTDIRISDSIDKIKVSDYYDSKNSKPEKINEGVFSVKNLGSSCNDADYNKVSIKLKKGKLSIDSLLNVSFFEYDLDNDGKKEQYIFGSRNCTKELAILRIQDRNEK